MMKFQRMIPFVVLLICCLVCVCSVGAAEESFVMPTVEPQETQPPESEFVIPVIPVRNKNELPDPALYLVKSTEEPVHQSDHYETAGKVYDVWYYPGASFPAYVYTHYKDDCEAAGFTVSQKTISDRTAYVISGTYEALIFPDYNDAVMTMVETGMTYSSDLPGDEWAYVTTDDASWSNQKVVRYHTSLSLNSDDGHTLTGSKTYEIKIQNGNEEIQQIDFTIPSIAKAGDKFYAFQPYSADGGITYQGIDPGINMTVFRYGKTPQLYVYEIVPWSSEGLVGKSDFLMLTINDVNRVMSGKQITGELMGMFKNLSDVIIINFSVIVPD